MQYMHLKIEGKINKDNDLTSIFTNNKISTFVEIQLVSSVKNKKGQNIYAFLPTCKQKPSCEPIRHIFVQDGTCSCEYC